MSEQLHKDLNSLILGHSQLIIEAGRILSPLLGPLPELPAVIPGERYYVFLGQMTVSYDALFSKAYTFCLPYRCITSASRAEDIFQILGICAAETVIFALIKLFLIKIRRQPV